MSVYLLIYLVGLIPFGWLMTYLAYVDRDPRPSEVSSIVIMVFIWPLTAIVMVAWLIMWPAEKFAKKNRNR
jgi:hypothetical protein